MRTHQVSAETRQRVVRVFVSSTFQDMHAERDELIKRVFPHLRKLCEERGVAFSEVDLRWGISDEVKAEGRVLTTCLAEIHACRPYFIGLLGERYGWVPDDIPQELLEQQPWLADQRGRSVTELEILLGVLHDPTLAKHACLYFRAPDSINALPVDQQGRWREGSTPEEIEKYGAAGAESFAESRRRKLVDLKERIRQSGSLLRENYPDARTLGEWVMQDLTVAIDQDYPPGPPPHPLDREAAEHEAFAQSRARVYIGRSTDFDRLDAHSGGVGPPLVILGESGVGKSALLANWVLRYRVEHPDDLVLMHFIGASPHSADWVAMLQRIMAELGRRFKIEQQIPDQPDILRSAFAQCLLAAALRGRVVLILDGLNQLEDRDGAPDLVWLPLVVPGNFRLILSTLPGRPLDDLRNRDWPTLCVEALHPDERQQLITGYLALYGKALSPTRVRRIAAANQAANPLYLRAVLEEMRVFGMHEEFDARVTHYLAAPTISDLYERILERYEQDYEDRPHLVRDALSLLWAARHGLSEAEVVDLLGSGGEPLPHAHWAPLHLAAEHALVSHSGLIGIGHDHLRQAIRDRYLFSDARRASAHLQLASYFLTRVPGPRATDELPWQLAAAGDWQRLCDVLSDVTFLHAASALHSCAIKTYWAQIEAHSPLRLVDAYQPILEAPGLYRDTGLDFVAILLVSTGHAAQAVPIYEYLVQYYREAGRRSQLAGALANLATALGGTGDVNGALALLTEHEQIAAELGWREGVALALGKQALLRRARDEHEAALELYERQEGLCRELGFDAGLSIALNGRALLLQDRGDLSQAMELFKELERVLRRLGQRGAALGLCSVHQANILEAQGDLQGTIILLRKAASLMGESGDYELQSRTLFQLGFLLGEKIGQTREGLATFRDACAVLARHGIRTAPGHDAAREAARRGVRPDALLARANPIAELMLPVEARHKEWLASMGRRAMELVERGQVIEAFERLEEQELAARALGEQHFLQKALGDQALMLTRAGRHDDAMNRLQEREQICRSVGDLRALAHCVGGQSIVASNRGEFAESLRRLRKQEDLYRELGDAHELSATILNQAVLLVQQMRRPAAEALPLAQQACEVARSGGVTKVLGEMEPFLIALIGRITEEAFRCYDSENLGRAKELFGGVERVCRTLDRPDLLQAALGNLSLVLKRLQDLDGALAALGEQEHICRAASDRDALQGCLGNKALVLEARGEIRAALAALNEREALCRESGDRQGLALCLGSLAQVLFKAGDPSAALRAHEEEERICLEGRDLPGLERSWSSASTMPVIGNRSRRIDGHARHPKYASVLLLRPCRRRTTPTV